MLKFLCCPFSLVLFIYSQTEACWFVGVTWPALIWGGGYLFPSQAMNPATPSLWVTVLHPQLLPLGILVYPSVALETWGFDHHALFTHLSLKNIFSGTRMQMGKDNPPQKMQTKPPLAELFLWVSKCYALSTQSVFEFFFVWIFVLVSSFCSQNLVCLTGCLFWFKSLVSFWHYSLSLKIFCSWKKALYF